MKKVDLQRQKLKKGAALSAIGLGAAGVTGTGVVFAMNGNGGDDEHVDDSDFMDSHNYVTDDEPQDYTLSDEDPELISDDEIEPISDDDFEAAAQGASDMISDHSNAYAPAPAHQYNAVHHTSNNPAPQNQEPHLEVPEEYDEIVFDPNSVQLFEVDQDASDEDAQDLSGTVGNVLGGRNSNSQIQNYSGNHPQTLSNGFDVKDMGGEDPDVEYDASDDDSDDVYQEDDEEVGEEYLDIYPGDTDPDLFN